MREKTCFDCGVRDPCDDACPNFPIDGSEIESLRAQLASAKEEIELANQKREFAEFEWNRATEHAQKRDGQLASARKALEAFVVNADKAGDTNSDDRWYRGNAQAWRQAAKLIRSVLQDLP